MSRNRIVGILERGSTSSEIHVPLHSSLSIKRDLILNMNLSIFFQIFFRTFGPGAL